MKSFTLVCAVCGTVNQMSRTHCLACRQALLTTSDSDAPTASLLARRLLKGRYRVLHVVGKGGMGIVYIGVDTQLGNRLVAIKEMSQNGLQPSERFDAARNFKREAHLLASLQHPNLPSIYDHFEEDQRWYLVMSFIKGQTLTSYLETRGGKLPVDEVLEIGITLCSVLEYLHSRNPPIIFRDLKPPNIMRTVEGHIYLIDFGIARFFKPGQMVDTTSQGSSGYASPEQYGVAQTTPRSDIYSLGATLYHLLSGFELASSPFHFPPLQELVVSLPPALAQLIGEMLDLEEGRRPASAETVKQELQRIERAIGQEAYAAPPSRSLPLPEPAPVPARKSRKPLFVILPLLALLVLATALYFFLGYSKAPDKNTPAGVVATFCDAMNSAAPDYLTAYSQFSHRYQQEYSLLDFQGYLLGTNKCTIASAPDGNNRAVVSLTMLCPPPPPEAGIPPPPSPPPPQINPADLTLLRDGSNGWKIDTLLIIGHNCSPPSGTNPTG